MGCEQAVVAELRAILPIGRPRSLVKADGDVQLLQRGPQLRVVRAVKRDAVDEVGAHIDADGAEFADGAARLPNGLFRIVLRQHRGDLHPRRVGLAEVVEPVVVGAADRRRERAVHAVQPVGNVEADGGVHHGDVDALHVHRLELGAPVVVALAHRAGRLVGASAHPVHTVGVVDVAGREASAFEEEGAAALARRAGDAWGAVGEPRVEVALEQVGGLDDVHIGVHHFVAVAGHRGLLWMGLGACGLPAALFGQVIRLRQRIASVGRRGVGVGVLGGVGGRLLRRVSSRNRRGVSKMRMGVIRSSARGSAVYFSAPAPRLLAEVARCWRAADGAGRVRERR